jgi:hypothetical protein
MKLNIDIPNNTVQIEASLTDWPVINEIVQGLIDSMPKEIEEANE